MGVKKVDLMVEKKDCLTASFGVFAPQGIARTLASVYRICLETFSPSNMCINKDVVDPQ